MTYDLKYMRRALMLARKGEGYASPNPMVGAVIVAPDGKVIGEGYHRRCGEGHAEVNAVASVADELLLRDSTMYVTLEPCSHYGKTPPCAQLIIDKKIPRVVVATLDPFEKVAGRGVAMLRAAGVEIVVLDGDIAEECSALNRRFMTAHRLRRPYITLKWAQSEDGFMDVARESGSAAYRFSSPLTTTLVHRLRSVHDAVLTGSGTVLADNPRLDTRFWHGCPPKKVVLDRRRRLSGRERIFEGDTEVTVISDNIALADVLARLYDSGITSVLVEAGPRLLASFVEQGLWDSARVEVAPVSLGELGRGKAPMLGVAPDTVETLDGNRIYGYCNYNRKQGCN